MNIYHGWIQCAREPVHPWQNYDRFIFTGKTEKIIAFTIPSRDILVSLHTLIAFICVRDGGKEGWRTDSTLFRPGTLCSATIIIHKILSFSILFCFLSKILKHHRIDEKFIYENASFILSLILWFLQLSLMSKKLYCNANSSDTHISFYEIKYLAIM